MPWGLLTLGLLILLPGDALYRLLFRSPSTAATGGFRALSLGERLLLRLLGGVLLTGWWGLLLAELGSFSAWTVALGVIAIGATLYGLAWRARGGATKATPLRWAAPRPTAVGLALAAILLLTAGLLFSHPFETIVGAEDAGIYFNSGGSIARNGGILIADSGLATFGDAAANAAAKGPARDLLRPEKPDRYFFLRWQRLSGFFLLTDRPNTVTPQFLHLFPVWLALWAVLGGGVGAMVYGGPAFGLLGIAAAYCLARRLFGPAVGLLAALLLALNGLQLWFARQSLSEPLLQLLLLGAIYAWTLFIEARDSGDTTTARGAASLAGLALGSVALTHAQFVFALLPLGALVAWLWLSHRWNRLYWWFAVPLLLLLLHATVHIARYALGYFEGIYHHVWLNAWRDRGQTALILLGPLALVALLDRTRPRWLPLVATEHAQRGLRWGAAAGTALGATYAYLIWPGLLEAGLATGYIGAPVLPGPASQIVSLGWYFSPLGIALAVTGLVLLLLCDFDERAAALLCFVAPFAVLYFLTGTYTQGGYIYALRRYVPLIVPVASILVAYAALRVGPALAAALRRPRLARPLQALGLGAAGLLVVFFLYTNRPLLTHREYAGLLDDVARLAGRIGPNDLVLFSGPRDETPKLATPLHYLFGRESWVITTNLPNGAELDTWIARQEARGRQVRVLLAANGGKLLLPGHRLEPVEPFDFTLRQFETLPWQKPHNRQENQLRYSLYRLRPLGPGETVLGPLPYRVTAGTFAEPAQVQGFHNAEQTASGRVYHWTDGDALLRIPWPADGQPLTLRLTLSGGQRPTEPGPAKVCPGDPAGTQPHPITLGPAQVHVGLRRGTSDNERDERVLTTLTLTDEFAEYTIAIPADALPRTPDGAALVHLGVSAPPGCPGSAWRPVDFPLAARASSDQRHLHVRFAGIELVQKP